MLNPKSIPNFQKYTKIAVVLLGLSIVIASSFALNSSLYQNKGGNSKFAKDYDFYLQYNKANQLSPSYFTNKVAGGFEKIKIDVLPNHSDILLNNTKINAGDEINFGDLAKLAIFPKIDEYDNFKWSAVSGSNLLSTVVSKFGVGSDAFVLPKTIFSNETLIFTETELRSGLNPTIDTSEYNFLTIILSYPDTQLNGTLKFDNQLVTDYTTISINELDKLVYTPDSNYIGVANFVFVYSTFPGTGNLTGVFVNITINNRPPTTLPQSISGRVGDTITFPGFVATDSDTVGPATFTQSTFPVGFVCTESNAGQVGNIISCVVGPSVVPGTYTFDVTPIDSLGLAGTPVIYTIVVPFQTNSNGGTITISNSISPLINSTISSLSVSSLLSSTATKEAMQSLITTSSVNTNFDTLGTAKGAATIRTGGGN